MKNLISNKMLVLFALTVLLAGCGKGRSVADLIEALKSPDPKVRFEAAKSLGELGSNAEKAAPALTEALNDPEAKVRHAAARSLGKIGPGGKEAIPGLTKALKDTDARV